MIYVVEILDQKFIKIDFSKEGTTLRRIAELQTGNPFEIKEVFIIEGSLMQEQAIHSSLLVAMTRCGLPHPPNEWYPGTNPFMQQFLERLKFGANQGIAFAEEYNANVKRHSKKRGDKERHPKIKWPKMGRRDFIKFD
jgi:hypothetical protein